MTKDLLETLYSKKTQDFSKNDVKYIDKLLNNQFNDSRIKFCLIPVPIVSGVLCGVLSLMGLSLGISLGAGVLVGILGGLVSVGNIKLENYSLKDLGLTKKEWKELKKSGRLKELENMVEEYLQNEYSINQDLEYDSLGTKNNVSKQPNQHKVKTAVAESESLKNNSEETISK